MDRVDGPPWTLPFGGRDWVVVAAYVFTMILPVPLIVVVAALSAAGHPLDFKDPVTQAAAQTSIYVIVTLILLVAVRKDVARAARTFTDHPGLKWGLVPVFFFGNLIVLTVASAIVTALTGGVAESANQTGLTEMAKAQPFALMAISTVLCAPLVEEYIFRNLLIGKLSRRVNQWVCLGISSVAFTLLHALAGWPENPLTLVPYLVMGLTFGTIYILSGKSFVYSTIIHALHNLMALSLIYVLPSNLPT
ncbi:hypothetical protein GCM10009595_09120 [Falsarthrobacter nasiphocae]